MADVPPLRLRASSNWANQLAKPYASEIKKRHLEGAFVIFAPISFILVLTP